MSFPCDHMLPLMNQNLFPYSCPLDDITSPLLSYTQEELKEDIYGRLRDKHGNVVAPGTGAYVPPAKRLQAAQGEDAKQRLLVERTKRQIKGLINRLSEANLYATSNQIEAMYRHSSRAVLTECLADTILEACTGGATLPERLIMELCALVSVLHSTVGNEVGESLNFSLFCPCSCSNHT